MINEPVSTNISTRSKGRIGQIKSKNGCLTCKYVLTPPFLFIITKSSCNRIRRVKCSEERPQCHRCTSTGRKCDYKTTTGHDFRSWSRDSPDSSWRSSGSSSRSSQSPPLTVALDSHPTGGSPVDCSVELRAFEFFFMRGLSIFPRAIDDRFWKTCILQACHAEPVIWDAVSWPAPITRVSLNYRR